MHPGHRDDLIPLHRPGLTDADHPRRRAVAGVAGAGTEATIGHEAAVLELLDHIISAVVVVVDRKVPIIGIFRPIIAARPRVRRPASVWAVMLGRVRPAQGRRQVRPRERVVA